MTHRAEDVLPPLLALAQSAALIHHVASTGAVDGGAVELLIGCLFGDAMPGEEAAGRGDYAIGRAVLNDYLRGALPENQRSIARYMRVLARLERRLARRPEVLARLRGELAQLRERQTRFALPAASVHAALGEIYARTLGELRPALSVIGPWRQISDPHNADLIRTLILGGVQAARLWRRSGGAWWQLRFQRGRMLRILGEEAGN